ncbi:hypothetical protein GGF37_005982, partial [Kickxella alabastrina]
ECYLLFIWPAASDWEEIATVYSPDYNQLDLTDTTKACEKAVDGNRSAYFGAEGGHFGTPSEEPSNTAILP